MTENTKPVPDSFENYDDYITALVDYKMENPYARDPEPEGRDDGLDDDGAWTPSQMKAYNKKEAEELAAYDREEEQRYEKAWDDKKQNYKSLKHAMEYRGDPLPEWLPGSPDPKDYAADAEMQFWQDYTSFQQTGRLAGNLDPLPDDEFRAERNELVRQIRDHRQQAAIAEANGRTESAEIHNNLARHAENELRAVPRSEREIKAKDELIKNNEITADILFDPEMVNDPSWESERVQHDSAVFLAEHNKMAKKYVRLPIEDSRGGNPLPCKPSNMIKFGLTEEVMEQFKRHVYNSGNSMDPNSIFRRSWAFLYRNGYASTGEMAVKQKAKGKKSEKNKTGGYSDGMTQAEYEAWRAKQSGGSLRRF